MNTRPWTPEDIGGMVVWMMADDPAVHESGDLVWQLNNRVSGLPIVPGAPTALRTFERGDLLCGRQTLRATPDHTGWFAAIGTEMAISGVTGITAVCVQRQRVRGATGSYYSIVCLQRPNGNSRFVLWNDAYVGSSFSATCSYVTYNANANAPHAGTDWAILAGRGDWADSVTTARIDGSVAATAVGSEAAPSNEVGASASLIQIGGRPAGSSGLNYPNPHQDLAELIVFARALSDAELAQVEGYLAHAWDLQDQLAADHPFKAAAPTVELWDGETILPGVDGVTDTRRAPEGTLLVQQNADGEFALCPHGSQAGLALDAGLDSSVLVSLFCDARIDADEARRLGIDDRRGWWLDSLAPADGAWGSRLWALDRATASPESARQAEQRAREALQWMIDDAIAASVDCAAQWVHAVSGARLELRVTIRPTQHLISRYGEVWEATYEL